MKLSIITINYNNKEGLEKTIESVASQKLDANYEFEYIVIDGLSTDGSCELIKNSSIIAKCKIEKDSGIADAFNKGTELASGEYLYFLNSGDVFYDSKSLQYILNFLNENADIFIGKVAVVDENGKKLSESADKIYLQKQLYRNYLPHQGMIIKKAMFEKYGVYDIEYRLGMDYEWSLRFFRDDITLKQFEKFIAKMQSGGVSMTNFVGTFKAYHNARKKHGVTNRFYSYLISLFFICRRSVGQVLKKW